MVTNDDIIRDALIRFTTALQAAGSAPDHSALANKVEAEMRRDWGGSRVTIAKRGTAEERAERNSRIHRAYLNNVRLEEIARTERVSKRRVLQVVKSW